MEECLRRVFSWDVQEYFRKRNITITQAYYFLHIPPLCVMLLFFACYCRGAFIQKGFPVYIILAIALADVITFGCYYLFKKYSISWPMICGMSVTACALLATYGCDPITNRSEFSVITFAIIGFAQGIALLPGISRLALTTVVGCYMGFSLFNAFIFSWLVMIPLMLAVVSKTLITLYQQGTLTQLLNWQICLAMLVSGVISWYVLLYMLILIFTQKWWLLGWYMALPIGIWVLLSKKKTKFHL